MGCSFSIHYDFDDAALGKLLGLDGKREVCLAGVVVREGFSAGGDDIKEIAPLPMDIQATSKVSDREVHYDDIEAIHRAGATLPDSSEKAPEILQTLGIAAEEWTNIQSPRPEETEIEYPDAVFQRRSKRNYMDTQLSRYRFLRLLDLVCNAAGRDGPSGHGYTSTTAIGFLAGNIEKIDPGLYLLDSVRRRFGRVSGGPLTKKMASVCLNQEWLQSAPLHFLFMTNLDEIDRTWGPRGYRYAMLTAGRLGQTIYLGATALDLGCCGIGALYDGEARELLGLNEESALLYLVAAGPVKRL